MLAATPPPAVTQWTGHWSFDGNLLDDSGNGQDACLEKPAFAACTGGQALRLANEAAEIPDAPGLRLARGFRIACRVRFASLPAGNAWATVAMKGTHGEGDYFLRVDPASEGRQFAFFVNTGSWEPRVKSRQPVQTNVWYDVAAGWDDSGLWLTVNGETSRAERRGEPLDRRDGGPALVTPAGPEIEHDHAALVALAGDERGVAIHQLRRGQVRHRRLHRRTAREQEDEQPPHSTRPRPNDTALICRSLLRV